MGSEWIKHHNRVASALSFIQRERYHKISSSYELGRPGSPWENGFCESFNGTFRDNLLDGEIFYSLKEAQIIVGEWVKHYNHVRL